MTNLTEVKSDRELQTLDSYPKTNLNPEWSTLYSCQEGYSISEVYTFGIPESDTSNLIVVNPNFVENQKTKRYPFVTIFRDQLSNWIYAESFNNLLEQKILSNELEETLDFVYDTLDDLMISGKYSICNSILERLDIDRWPNEILIGILTITLSWKARLTSRSSLFFRVKEKLAKTYHEQEAYRIIDGLI